MNDFRDVFNAVKSIVPSAERIPAKVYQVSKDTSIVVSSPQNKFDTYQDVVAQIMIHSGDKIIFNRLITYNTDLDKLCKKLERKLILCGCL